jgi:hypothetical protein
MTWILNYLRNKNNPASFGNPLTYDSSPIRVSFFNTSKYQESGESVFIKRAWNTAKKEGHEVGVHTVNHSHGAAFSAAQWKAEISNTITHLTKPFDSNEQPGNLNPATGMGADRQKITGFRTPYLEYNDKTFEVLVQQGLTYDTSIEEGWESSQDGSNYSWPYTLNSGSPGNKYMLDSGFPNKVALSPRRGLWELGVHPLIVPPDNLTSRYGVNHSIRNKIKSNVSWFDTTSGKITGFDYNLWAVAKLNKAETLAVLKHTLDLRLQNGNRAPFMLGAHTDYYGSKNASLFSQISVRDRQKVIEEFIAYARSKPEVRIVPFMSIVNWMRNPSAINCRRNCSGASLSPVVTNPGNQSNKIDNAVDLTIQATDPNQFALKFSATNLPTGLLIDPVSGVISGVVSVKGAYSTSIKVSNSDKSSTIHFNWKITEASSVVDPWETIDDISDRLNILYVYNDILRLQFFKGSDDLKKQANRKFIADFLYKAIRQCWQGKPDKVIVNLNVILSKLDNIMQAGAERNKLKQKIKQEKRKLNSLLNANF